MQTPPIIKIAIGVTLVVLAGAVVFFATLPTPPSEAELHDAQLVVENFGTTLRFVPLLGEKVALVEAMETHYKPYVAPELLAQWEESTTTAPGRLTSSPWPDRIEVSDTQANADGSATIFGSLIEVTSATDTPPQAYIVTARLEKRLGTWLITAFSGGPVH